MSFTALFFLGICPFHLNCWIYRHEIIHNTLLCSFTVCGTWRWSPLSFLKVIIYVFSLFPDQFALSFILKEPAFIDFLYFSVYLFIYFCFIYFTFIFFISFLLLTLDLICPSFSSYLRLELKSVFLRLFSCFKIGILYIKFLLNILYFHFHSLQKTC